MPSVHRARRGAKKATKPTARKRTSRSSTRPAGRPRPPATKKTSKRTATAATPIPAPLFAALKALASRFAAEPESPEPFGDSPRAQREAQREMATFSILRVLLILIKMIEEWSTPNGDWLHGECLRFARFEDNLGVPGRPAASSAPPPSPSPAAPPSASPGDKAPDRTAPPHLRALGITHPPTIDEIGDASTADLLSWLFVGDDDPIVGILQGIARDTDLMSGALHDETGDYRKQLDMALCAIGSRAHVAEVFYLRVRAALQAEQTPGEGRRS